MYELLSGDALPPKAELTPLHARTYLTEIAAEETRRSLRMFIKRAWPQLQPQPLIYNWHIDAIADHLSFVTMGEIRFLMIQIGPRMTKTMVCSVLWPAWHWLHIPGEQFLTASVDDQLARDSAILSRRLIESPWYQTQYPGHVELYDDENTAGMYRNRKGGYRMIASVQGRVTGVGGTIQCLPAQELVWTDTGPVPIGELVREQRRLRAWSFDTATGMVELKPILGWHTNPGRLLVEVQLTDGAILRCTGDHRVWTVNRGYVCAQDLAVTDVLPQESTFDETDGLAGNPIHGGQTAAPLLRPANVNHILIGQFAGSTWLSRVGGPPQSIGDRSPIAPCSDVPNDLFLDPITQSQNLGILGTGDDIDDGLFCEAGLRMNFALRKCAMRFAVLDVLLTGSVLQIIEAGIRSIAIAVPYFLADATRADESPHHLNMDLQRSLFGESQCAESGIAFTRTELKKPFPNEGHRASLLTGWNPTSFAAHASKIGDAIEPFVAHYRSPVFVREVGHADLTYCLTVADNHNFFAGNGKVLVANCLDDPVDAKKVQSDAVRHSTLAWHDNAWRSRVNNPDFAKKVYIGQRTHEADPFGHVLAQEGNRWVHLVLPMEFNPAKRCITYLNKGDGVTPGAKPIFQDPRTLEREILDPKRMSAATVNAEKRIVSEAAWQAQYNQDPIGLGGLILKRHWWRPWVQPDWRPNAREERPMPRFDELIQVWDTALEEDEQDDFSACTTWGTFSYTEVFLDKSTGRPVSGQTRVCAMLLDAVKERYAYPDLRQKAIDLNRDFAPDTILIEKKVSGHSLIQELRKKRLPVKGVKLSGSSGRGGGEGDLVARAHAASLMLEKGTIFYPPRPYAYAVIDECSGFPNADHDDYVSTVVIALMYLRRYHDLQLPDDDRDEISPWAWKRRPQKRYA